MSSKVPFCDVLVLVVSDYFPLYVGERDASTTLLFYTSSRSDFMHRLIALRRFA